MSKVTAIAVFLDWHLKHRAFDKTLANGQVRTVPSRNQDRLGSDSVLSSISQVHSSIGSLVQEG